MDKTEGSYFKQDCNGTLTWGLPKCIKSMTQICRFLSEISQWEDDNLYTNQADVFMSTWTPANTNNNLATELRITMRPDDWALMGQVRENLMGVRAAHVCSCHANTIPSSICCFLSHLQGDFEPLVMWMCRPGRHRNSQNASLINSTKEQLQSQILTGSATFIIITQNRSKNPRTITITPTTRKLFEPDKPDVMFGQFTFVNLVNCWPLRLVVWSCRNCFKHSDEHSPNYSSDNWKN